METKNTKTKKILHYASKTAALITLVFLVFSPFNQILVTPVAHAEIYCTNTSRFANNNVVVFSDSSGKTCEQISSLYRPSTQTEIDNNNANNPGAKNAIDTARSYDKGGKFNDDSGCNVTSGTGWSICLSNIVYVFTVGLGSGMAYIGAFVFDATVSLSLNSAAYALSFLSTGWSTARDLANMAFILILAYIAFKIMFESEDRGTMQMLAWVIFIALIINFSFFLTRVVIDTGNILAVQFYNSIDAPTLDKTFSATSGGLAGASASSASFVANKISSGTLANTKDLTASIMGALNIQQLFGTQAFQGFLQSSGFLSKLIILSILYIAIGAAYFILAAMFIAVGIKFLARVVVLWFLIIVAPLAFIAKAVPNPVVSVFYGKWQRMLINHVFYPAIFLFIFFFISTVMGGLTGATGILGGLATDLNSLASNQDIGGVVYLASAIANVAIRLGFVIAMLYIALKASESISVQGAGVAHSVTDWASRKGTSAAFGGFGYTMRNTVGRAGYAASRSTLVNKWAASSVTGRPVKALLGGLGRSSYDARVGAVKSTLSAVGVDTSKSAGKGGFAQQVTDRAKNVEARAKDLKTADDANAIRKQQKLEEAKFKAEYDKKWGSGKYDEEVGKFTQNKADAEREIKEAEKELKKAQSRHDGVSMEATTRLIEDEKRKQKAAEDGLKKLQAPADAGKKALQVKDKERITKFANRIGQRGLANLGFIRGPFTPVTGPSRGSLEGATKALKLVAEKSKEQKALDTLKEAMAAESAPTPGAHPLTRAAMERTRSRGPLEDSTAKLQSAMEKQTDLFRQAVGELRKSNKTTERGFSALSHTIERSSATTDKSLHKVQDSVTRSAEDRPPAPSAKEIARESAKINATQPEAIQPPKNTPPPHTPNQNED